MTMSGLTMTQARRDVLAAVARGEVKRRRGWAKGEKTRDTWHQPDGTKANVARQCNDLYAAKLIRPGRAEGPSMYAPQVWELTDAGRAAAKELLT